MSYTAMPTQSTGDTWTADSNNTYVRDNFAAGIPHFFDAKGDLAIASALDTAVRLPVGEDEAYLVRDDAEDSGVNWGNGAVPIGGILIWSGSTGTIPSGWQICNGTNNTPDLRDRFVIGSEDNYAVNTTGGAATKDLQHSSHTWGSTNTESDHTHTLASSGDLTGGAHAHTHPTNTGQPIGGTQHDVTTSVAQSVSEVTHTHPTPSAGAADGAHTHSITGPGNAGEHSHTVNAATGDGLGASESILPPYYALAYIMRLS